MGDRGNIRIIQQKKPLHEIYIYSHWGGSGLPRALRNSLARAESRWGEFGGSYLTRILITDICRPAGDELTGYGVSIARTDNELAIRSRNRASYSAKMAAWASSRGQNPLPEEVA